MTGWLEKNKDPVNETVVDILKVRSTMAILVQRSSSALMVASEEGQLEVVKLLVEKCEAKIDQTNPEGWSALMSACLNGHHDVAQLLLVKKAERMTKDLP